MNVVPVKPVINLYAEPEMDSEIVSQLLYGSPALALEEHLGWGHLQGRDGYTGWAQRADYMRSNGLEFGEGRRRVSDLFANLRYRPDQRSGPHLCLPIGVSLPVAEEEGIWTGLRLPTGDTGWVESKRTEPDLAHPTTVDALLETAQLFIGVPYLWGGVSGFGIDCSGFAQAVFRRHGIDLPRDAHQQAEYGAPVERREVQAGDLIYFAPSADAPRRRITHVGIALDSGRMIHALGGESVVKTPIESVQVFWGARRVLPHEE